MTPIRQPLSPNECRMLEETGWVFTQCKTEDAGEFELAVLRLGRFLGTPTTTRSRRFVDRLTPKPAYSSHPRSLSRMTGTGQQPWHMDMAHRLEPARFLVMGMHECPPKSANTELLDVSTLIPAALQDDALTEPFFDPHRSQFVLCHYEG